MALSIMNNSTAIGAMGNLNKSNSALGKTISQLSSGLRINSAADDASGLAVSEKLRGQIRGLGKAASNAQDAISLLQTAEAGMGSMTDILQRMRELAVQAGDPAYTTNDRSMLQLEVDQLKNEINRISTSTEFNTKKLLNGDAAGVWSSDNAQLEAILRGAPAEGNYTIDTTVKAGNAYGYKTSVMNIGNEFGTINGLVANAGIDGINTRNMMAGNFRLGITLGSGTNTTDALNMLGNSGFSGQGITAANITGSATATGYFEFEALKDFTGTGAVTGAIRVTFTNALTGKKESQIGNLSAAGLLSGVMSFANVGTAAVTIATGAVITTVGAGGFKVGAKSAYANTEAIVAKGNRGEANIELGSSAGKTLVVKVADVTNTRGTKVSLTTAQWNTATNTLVMGEMEIAFKATINSSGLTALAPTTTGKAVNGGVANNATTLNRLNNFVNSDGRNVLANAQKLSIYGNGTTTSISIEGSDTIKDVLDKLNGAFKEMGYGDTVAQFVQTPVAGSDTAVQGTFVINSKTVMGEDSKISFVGDQSVLNGLGVNTIREGVNNTTSVTIKDAHGNGANNPSILGKDLTVTDGMIRDVIKGVDIKISLTASGTSVLHIKDNATKVAIGANEGQTLDISIGRVDATALEIDNIVVATFDDSQKAITKIDKAMETLSQARAVTGAQMNRLDYSINNLNTMKENLTSAESRLRDLDIAQASTDMTAQQVRLQAATAMLAQANQMPSYAAQLLK